MFTKKEQRVVSPEARKDPPEMIDESLFVIDFDAPHIS
jgi:hypothetical protein